MDSVTSKTDTAFADVASDFPAGTFAPQPRQASGWHMALAQGRVEAKLMLRHGEQLLLSVIIPLALLIGAAKLPMLADVAGIQQIFPMVLAVAATSAGFTGEAISLAFDRRYSALKRTGASGVPTWTIVAGKVIGVATMVAVQVVLLTAAAYALGFRASVPGLAMGAVTLLVGVAAFTALGILLGGTLPAEVVLAVANLIWFILLGTVGWVMYSHGLGHNGFFNVVPTVALAGGFDEAFSGIVPWGPLLSLIAWALIASAAAVKWFRFEA